KHQQSLPGNSSLGFPQSRFRGPVPAKLCLQVSVDAAFRVANHLPQCAQALLGSDPSNNRAAGRPYGLSGGVFFVMVGRIQGYSNQFLPPPSSEYGNITVPA
ncbi:hypothetical protein, partial [Candidatus Accumulibacter contiguus]|uniref:hypothetical protein n=1 Tax=Candidatus Accumulibacter contiguus TaxID=2954381 RepID=UPI001B7DB8AD